MNGQDIERIRASQGWRRDRVEVFETADGPVIAKGQRAPHSNLGYAALNLLARMTGSRVLQAVPMHGGPASQEVELRRLAALQAAGVRVPEVLHTEAGFFVMELVPGRNLAQWLAGRPANGLALWQQGLEAIRQTHARGQYLSQAHARNFIVTPQGPVAIDFEDDPLEVMTLAEAQAHDWLVYLLSTLWLLPEAHPRLLSIWEQYVEVGRGQQADILMTAARRLGWMRHLPQERKPWGRDVISAQAAASFLYDWAQPRPH
jgi:tRNA A-37 threonylcarbamoyl transferase component Bud32